MGLQGFSESEIRRRFPGAKIGGGPAAAVDTPKRKKYGNESVSLDGIRFDSKREGNHYEILKALRAVGKIHWFAIKPVFVIEGGKYIPDFIVMYLDGIRVEDVKAWDKKTQQYITTALYRRAKKQMKERYGIDVVEI